MSQCEECPNYAKCNATLCPLDEDLDKRTWEADEDSICTSTTYSKNLRWIKKQRSIKRKKTKSWFGTNNKGKPVSHQDLVDASRPPKISEEALLQKRERMKALQQARRDKHQKMAEEE